MRKKWDITKEDNIPLIGAITFGIIDRGTNLLQLRAISGCPLNCIYCSVDEGHHSKKRNTYVVELNYLVSELNKVIKYKNCNDVEIHIDGVGEPTLYPKITELIKLIRKNKSVKTISMQSNGFLLNEKKIKDFEKAGLDRINLSINSFDEQNAKNMSGIKSYKVSKIKKLAEILLKSKIKILIAPVWVPKYNDNLAELILFAKKNNAIIGIQKYERQKHGRRLKTKEMTWFNFWKELKAMEKKYGYKLILSKNDFNIHKAIQLPKIFKKNEIVSGKIVLGGWLSNEVIISLKNRLITVFGVKDYNLSDKINAKIVKIKHNIYLAQKLN